MSRLGPSLRKASGCASRYRLVQRIPPAAGSHKTRPVRSMNAPYPCHQSARACGGAAVRQPRGYAVTVKSRPILTPPTSRVTQRYQGKNRLMRGSLFASNRDPGEWLFFLELSVLCVFLARGQGWTRYHTKEQTSALEAECRLGLAGSDSVAAQSPRDSS